MSAGFDRKLKLAAAFCGILYAVVVFIGFGLIAEMMLPVWDPEDSAAEVVANFEENRQQIRIGMLVVMTAALLAIPFTAALCQQLTRIEGKAGILTWSMGLGGVALMVLTFYPAIFWLVAAYRPSREDDLIHLMSDLGWLQFIGGVTIFLAMPLAMAIAAFADSSENPLFPRWAGYYNLWTILLILPDQLLFFFKDGPFAWNGMFGFWIPVVVFGAWFPVTWWMLKRAIDIQDDAAPVGSTVRPHTASPAVAGE